MSSAAPARTDAFQSRMANTLPAVTVAPAGHQHCVDDTLPEIAVRPRSEDELARVLADAQGARLTVIAVGSGTHLQIGNLAERYDVALETSGINETLDHEPDDMTATVDAGVTLGALQAKLAERGQRLPIDPPIEEGADATIGGLLAINAYGPMRHVYGTLRDWVIGMRVAHPDGTVTKSGGRVVKNVSGYDMHKLHIGALGSLGIITQATFKLAPHPSKFSTTVVHSAPSAASACAVVLRSRDDGLAIQSAEVLTPAAAEMILGASGWFALMRVAGSSAAIDRSLRELRANTTPGTLEEIPHDAWLNWSDTFAPSALSLRVSVLPTRVAGVLDELAASLSASPLLVTSTVAAGVIRIKAMETQGAFETIDVVRRAAERAGGSLVIDAAPPDVKARCDVFGATRSDFEITRRLKEQFDPHRTLAPGRFIGRL